MTTIPYDEGWIVKVDGEAVKISKSFDAFITFEVDDAGEHTVEFIYRSDAFVYGAICSVVCLVIFILIVVFEKRIYALFHKKEASIELNAIDDASETTITNNEDGE
jgi:uncharacterized membrane protein YfhO